MNEKELQDYSSAMDVYRRIRVASQGGENVMVDLDRKASRQLSFVPFRFTDYNSPLLLLIVGDFL